MPKKPRNYIAMILGIFAIISSLVAAKTWYDSTIIKTHDTSLTIKKNVADIQELNNNMKIYFKDLNDRLDLLLPRRLNDVEKVEKKFLSEGVAVN